jgi:uncharacterized protein
MFHEKFLPTLQDLSKRYPHFYTDISALTLPNRMRMLLQLRRYSEIHERLLFGTLRRMIRKNPFDRQVEVCHRLKLGFHSLGDLLPHSTAKTTS